MNTLKKRISISLIIISVCICGGIVQNRTEKSISEWSIANVEALAGFEGSDYDLIYCCGNISTCAKVIDESGNPVDIKGIKSSVPCNF